MGEINLLDYYPRSIRPIEERGRRKLAREGWLSMPEGGKSNIEIMLEHQLLEVARRFGKEYFDSDRLYGYGGYYYDPRFWTETVKRFHEHYQLADNASILDVGCAKGFMLYDFKKLMPKANLQGIDISTYASDHAFEEIQPLITVGNAKQLSFADKSFDLVIAINTVDHLPLEGCKEAIREIIRVAKKNAFICVNAWRNNEEKERLLKWNVTAQTCMYTEDWKKLFKEVGYTGDYWWFIAE